MYLPSIYFTIVEVVEEENIRDKKLTLPIKVIFTVCASINSLFVLHDDHTISLNRWSLD